MTRKNMIAIAVAAAAIWAGTGPAMAEDVTIKLWSRADRSGPLRAGNIVDAAAQLNRMLAATGSDKRVKIDLIETNAKGYDDDSLDLLKAFAVDKGPDIFVLAHEWIGAFADAGYTYNLEEHIKKNPEFYNDMIPALWESVKFKGVRYGVPQDSEVRMVFLNNDKLRAMGMSDADIAALPKKVEDGAFTAFDLCDLGGSAVSKGVTKYGLLHRPNTGPDFQMLIEAFGVVPYDKATNRLQAPRAAYANFFKWVKHCVDKKAIPATNTSMSWDAVNASAIDNEESLAFFHGIWRVGDQMKAYNLKTQADYFKKITWIQFPSGEKGGKPTNLSHPIAYAVSSKSKNAELSAYLVALASQPVLNTKHAITTNHTPISYGQTAMAEFVDGGWALVAGTPMLKNASVMPNHPKIGQYNAVLYKGIQGVETGRLQPEAAASFVVDELQNELGKDVVILK
jgi:inositol-phosphate transport system substrate-binding protein